MSRREATAVWQVVGQRFRHTSLSLILTAFTMAIGAMGLAGTLFLGRGALEGLWQDLDKLMGNRLEIYPDAGPAGSLLRTRPDQSFTPADMGCVQRGVVHAKYVEAIMSQPVSVFAGGMQSAAIADGIGERMEEEILYRPISGRHLSEGARQALLTECLATRALADALGLYGNGNTPVQVTAGPLQCRVVGVVENPPGTDSRFERRLIMPYSVAQSAWGRPGDVGRLVVAWSSAEEMGSTVDEVRGALDACRGADTYYLSSSKFAVEKRRNIVSKFMAFGLAQALFGILVASIGIVNVMLAGVVQHAREFGIRIAMGASPVEIGAIVITESVLLAVVGSGVGVLIAAVGAGPLAHMVAGSIPQASGLEPRIDGIGVIVPVLVCALSGLIAGIVPAVRASRVDVLGVLRAE